MNFIFKITIKIIFFLININKIVQVYFLNARYSYFALKNTHFEQVLENFAQECACTSSTFEALAENLSSDYNLTNILRNFQMILIHHTF